MPLSKVGLPKLDGNGMKRIDLPGEVLLIMLLKLHVLKECPKDASHGNGMKLNRVAPLNADPTK